MSTNVAESHVEFISPIEYDDDVYVDLRVTKVGTSSWRSEYRVRAISPDGTERIAATGYSVQVAWARPDDDSRPLPDEWRRTLAADIVSPQE